METLKFCPDCHKDYPATTEYFARDKSKADGWCRVCKTCHNARTRLMRATYAERMAARDPSIRLCTRCNQVFPATLEYFYAAKNNGPNALRSICKPCTNIQNEETRDPDKRREYERQYAVKTRDKRRKACRDWRARNLDRARENDRNFRRNDPNHREKSRQWRLKNPDKQRQQMRNYRENNREKLRVILHRYVARKAALPANFTDADWQFTLDWWEGRCAYCGRPPGLWHILAMDHFLPLNSPSCTGTVPANIVPACHNTGGCNNSKHDRDPQEWIMAKFGERRGREILARIQKFFSEVRQIG